ncbi:protein translocase SEC61 complex subunit gamma [Candidatus Heimdallarchaeota archaeon B3_Heim]|nr:MAG: protein translocase SEC61 complex subunit gamma [Candidatus Heimdallarchaeota archaeon B3_Heim]
MGIDNSRMGSASFYKRALRIMRLAKKPDRSEVSLVIKITIAGMAILGFIAFVIRFIIFVLLGREL